MLFIVPKALGGNHGANTSEGSSCNYSIVVNGCGNHTRGEREDPILVLSQVVLYFMQVFSLSAWLSKMVVFRIDGIRFATVV